MITSDWGDWLPREIATTTPDRLGLWYLGCNGAAINTADGTTVLIDPYLGTGDPPRTVRSIPVPFAPQDVTDVDAIMITHAHTDHLHAPSQAPILAETGATLYAPETAIEQTTAWSNEYDLDGSQRSQVAPGDMVRIGEMAIHVADAYDPDAEQPVSYIFDPPTGPTVFHGGDARPSEAFASIGEDYDVTVGLLAFGSAGMIPDKETGEPQYTKWYNDENEIIKAATQLDLEVLVPTHWDMWRGLTADPTALVHHARRMPAPEQVRVLSMGDQITY